MNAGGGRGLDIGVLEKHGDIDWARNLQIRQYIKFIHHYFLLTMILRMAGSGQ